MTISAPKSSLDTSARGIPQPAEGVTVGIRVREHLWDIGDGSSTAT